jgi:hypothetical protein
MSTVTYKAVVWSSVDIRLISLVEKITSLDGGIPVLLVNEIGNPWDSQAVIVAISTETVMGLLGVDRLSLLADGGNSTLREDYWRLGYIRRVDPGKAELWQSLQSRDTLLHGRLYRDSIDWVVRVHEADPNDSEIPF